MAKQYVPVYKVSDELKKKVEVCEGYVERWNTSARQMSLELRKDNIDEAVRATLAIENINVELSHIHLVRRGSVVTGPRARAMKEAANTLSVYESLPNFVAVREWDFLKCHGILMNGLLQDAGKYRSQQNFVGDINSKSHVPCPPGMVPRNMANLFSWIKNTDEHPLIVSAVAHHEIEFIHPFMDGNGRMGRAWQSKILMEWEPSLAFLPVETLIKANQAAYYRALGLSDVDHAGIFAEFMVDVIIQTIREQLDKD